MFRSTLPLVLFLATSCLAAPTDVPENELSPLCKDLESMVKWNTGKSTEQQYLELQGVCMEAGDSTTEKTSDDVVDRMIRCRKLENSNDMTDPIKKDELDNCILELNCYKRFYMEGAHFSPDDYEKEFPLVWRGAEVKVDSPPSETFTDQSSCSKFSGSTEKTQDKFGDLASGMPTGLKMDLDKVKGDIMKKIQKNKEDPDTSVTDPAQKENVDRELDMLLSDIIDGLFKILGDPAFRAKETQEEAKRELRNIQQLLMIIPKYNENSFVAKLVDRMQKEGASDPLSPIVTIINYVFDVFRAKKTKQSEPVKLEAQPGEEKKE